MTTPVVVGVDLGATHVRAARVSRNGELGRVRRGSSGPAATPEGMADLVANLVREVAGKRPIRAVGVGVAAWIEKTTGRIAMAPNLGWRDVPFGDLVRAKLDAPVHLVNDLKAIAWGEYRFGAGRGAESMVAVYVGSGIGSGAVVHGRLIEGAGGFAGEIGHLRVGRALDACGCGAHGCLEALVGGRNLSTILVAEAIRGHVPELLERAGGDPALIHPGLADALVAEGNAHLGILWADVAEVLARGLGAVVSLFNPDKLVLGGSVWTGCAELRRRTEPLIARHTVSASADMVQVVAGALDDSGGIGGAADLARRSLGRMRRGGVA